MKPSDMVALVRIIGTLMKVSKLGPNDPPPDELGRDLAQLSSILTVDYVEKTEVLRRAPTAVCITYLELTLDQFKHDAETPYDVKLSVWMQLQLLYHLRDMQQKCMDVKKMQEDSTNQPWLRDEPWHKKSEEDGTPKEA